MKYYYFYEHLNIYKLFFVSLFVYLKSKTILFFLNHFLATSILNFCLSFFILNIMKQVFTLLNLRPQKR
jgi:hypothetical protein